jgi:hypothetical protein
MCILMSHKWIQFECMLLQVNRLQRFFTVRPLEVLSCRFATPLANFLSFLLSSLRDLCSRGFPLLLSLSLPPYLTARSGSLSLGCV